MSRSQRRGRVRPKRPNGWLTGEHGNPIRRDLNDATLFDRLLMSVIAFVAAALITGVIYWRMSLGSRRIEITPSPLYTMTGNEARMHFLLVCVAGGLVGAAGYALWSWLDPYGTTAVAKAKAEAAEKAREGRFAFLAQRDSLEPTVMPEEQDSTRRTLL